MNTAPEKSDVFVSYARRAPDQKWVKEKLVPALRNSGLSVTFDDDHFVAGRELSGEMSAALENSRWVLAILSPAYDMNRMAGSEAFGAFQSKRLIPVVVRPTHPPAWMQGLLWQDWTTDAGLREGWVKLLSTLGAKLMHAAPPPRLYLPRRRSAVAAAAGVALAVAAGGWLWYNSLAHRGAAQERSNVPEPKSPVKAAPAATGSLQSTRSSPGMASGDRGKRAGDSEEGRHSPVITPPSTAVVTEPPHDAPADRVRAFELAEAGHCSEAIPMLERVAASAPRDGQVFFALGNCYAANRDSANARQNFARALELGHAPAAVHTELARVALQSGDTGEAERQIDKALAASPGFAGALLVRGDVFMKQRKYSDAVQTFDLVLQRTRSAESCNKLADAYAKNGAPERAETQRSVCKALH
jgi:tetratricopeptide (TPR) repeat protein